MHTPNITLCILASLTTWIFQDKSFDAVTLPAPTPSQHLQFSSITRPTPPSQPRRLPQLPSILPQRSGAFVSKTHTTANPAQLLQPGAETAQTQPPSDIFRRPERENPPILPETAPVLPPPENLLSSPLQTPPTSEAVLYEFPGTIVVERFEVVGSTVFSREQLAEATKKFINRPITFAELLQASEAITKLYSDKGYVTSAAFLPSDQTFNAQGVVRIQVVEGRLKDIVVRGTRKLSPNYVRGQLSVAGAKPLNLNRLLQALQKLLFDPQIKSISAELSAGSVLGTSFLDVTIGEPTIVPPNESEELISEFIVTGRGGLPPSPNEVLTIDVVWTDSRIFTLSSASLLQQGLQLYQTEQFSRSVQVLQQAAKTFQTQGDFLNQALALNYVALAYQQLGQLPKASTAIAESLNLLQKNRINSKEYIKVRAQTLNNLGQIQLAEGKSEKALASWEEATTLYAKIRDSEGEIGSKINQVQALQALGFYRRARLNLTDINKLLQAQPDSLLKANGLLSLGNALRVAGVLDQTQPQEQPQQIENFGSKQALEQSLAVASKLNSGEFVSQIYLSLGNTAQALQRTDAAMQYYGQAAASSLSPTTRVVAQINQLRLSLEEPQQQPKEVGQKVSYQNLQQTLLPQIQSQLDSLAPSRKTVYARINYAQTLACLRQKTEARGTPINAINVNCPKLETSAENITTNNIPEWRAIAQIVATVVEQAKSLEDKRAEAYALGTLGGLYEQTQQLNDAQKLTQQASALAENIPAPDIGYRWQWQLGRILKTRGDQTGAKAAYTKAVNNLKSIRGDLVAMGDVQYSFQEAVELIYRELVSLLLQSGNKQTSQDDLDTARNVIESLKVAELDNFFRRAWVDTTPVQIDQIDRTAAVIYPVILPDRVEVIVSLPSSSTKQKQSQDLRHYTKILPQNEVEQKLEELRQKLETRQTPEFLVPSQEIYEWIIKPIEPELEKRQIQNLVFVLDGPMRSIPMAALYDGKSYLVQKYNIALTPGLELLNPQPFARTERRTIAGGLSEARSNFPALPAAKSELLQISSILPSKLLLNQEFTSENLKEQLNTTRFPILHLATHGQFSSKAEDTFLLTFDGRIKVNELSYLLSSRDLKKSSEIELLVLSSASTAAGDNRAALGIVGVAVQSGARSVIAPLWVVDDDSTVVLMTRFYREWLTTTGVTKAEALRRAQESLLHDPRYQHPYYWAPFVLVGNWL